MLQYFGQTLSGSAQARGDRRQMDGYVESLVKLGVWTRVVSRLEAAGQEAAAAECRKVLRELQAVEKAEMASVVRGENYHTIWTAGS